MQDYDTLQVKIIVDEHICNKSKVDCKAYVDKLKSNPFFPLNTFQKQVMANHKVKVIRSKLFRAKGYAMKMVQGSLNEHNSLLHDYATELNMTNHGTTVQFVGKCLNCHKFKRMYICLEACKRVFVELYIPLIKWMGVPFERPTGKILMPIVSVDGNISILTYAIVESKNKDYRMWFIDLLKTDIGFNNLHGWTFISDKQKGLIPALEALCPNSEIRFCVRYLYKV